MKLYFNETQRKLIVEIMKASETQALAKQDAPLIQAFQEILAKVEPTNLSYISLKRHEAEALVEFCEFSRMGLDKALVFLEKEDKENKEELKKQAIEYRDELEKVVEFIHLKIKENP